MPRLEFFLISESLSTDQSTNQLSVFNILDDITMTLPAVLPRLVATSAWNFQPEEIGNDFQVILRVYRPNGDVLDETGDISVNFTAERSRHRVHQDVRGLPLTESGDWRLEILLNGKHTADHTLTVHATNDA